MVRRSIYPTPLFWNFLGFAIAVLSVGTSWSISQAKVYELELAEYKIAVGGALNKVQKVSDTLEQSAKTLPIATPQRAEIKQQIEESNAVIQQAQEEIDQEVFELTQDKQDKTLENESN